MPSWYGIFQSAVTSDYTGRRLHVVRSEMPKATEGNLWGFQLWVNLPAKDKMTKPRCAAVLVLRGGTPFCQPASLCSRPARGHEVSWKVAQGGVLRY